MKLFRIKLDKVIEHSRPLYQVIFIEGPDLASIHYDCPEEVSAYVSQEKYKITLFIRKAYMFRVDTGQLLTEKEVQELERELKARAPEIKKYVDKLEEERRTWNGVRVIEI